MRLNINVHPIIATIIIAGVLILLFTVFKGCKQSRIEVAAKEKAQQITDSALTVLKDSKSLWDSTSKDYQDSLEFERGQKILIDAQKERTEVDLDKALEENKELIARHHLADYTDTATIVVPNQYVMECEDCFTKLDNTTKLSLKYKDDLKRADSNWNKQTELYQNRFKQLNAERLGFYNKINYLAKEAKEATDKLKPHGRLYLSWGILWSPWPVAAGGGFMYQTKSYFQYGLKFYYGDRGSIVETSMHFPLSIKF